MKIFSCVRVQPKSGQGRLIVEVSRYNADTSLSVGLLRTSDQSISGVASYTTQIYTRDQHPCPQWVGTRDPSNQLSADLCLRSHGHRNLQL